MEKSVPHSICCSFLFRKTGSDIHWSLYRVFIVFTRSQIEPRVTWLHPPPSPSLPHTVQNVFSSPWTSGQDEVTGLTMELAKDSSPFILPKYPQQRNILLQKIGFCIWWPSQSETRPHTSPRNTPTISDLDSVSCHSKGGLKHCFLETSFTNSEDIPHESTAQRELTTIPKWAASSCTAIIQLERDWDGDL